MDREVQNTLHVDGEKSAHTLREREIESESKSERERLHTIVLYSIHDKYTRVRRN